MQTNNDQLSRLQPLGVWDILDTTFSLYRRHFLLYLSFITIYFISNLIDYTVKGYLSDNNLKQLLASIASQPIALLCLGGMVVVTASIYLGNEITTINALKHTFKRLWTIIKSYILWRLAQAIPLFLISLSMTSVIHIGSWALVVMTIVIGLPILIYISVRWIFYLEAVLVENTNAIGALQRSSDLVRENWWRVFGTVVLLLLSSSAFQYIFELSISSIFLLFNLAGGTDFRSIVEWSFMNKVLDTNSFLFYIIMIGSKFVINSLVVPIWVIGVVILYFDRRIRKEGYDLERNATSGTDYS
ncbi:MAG: hypothetical protein OXD54_14920 [Candidatus Poribacteria bacterium]|nr:hypothetical protein [Candidatus Poribacteria bacterium]